MFLARAALQCGGELRHDSAQVADQRHIDRAVLADRFRIEFDVDPLAIDIAVGPQVATAVVRRLADFGTDGDDRSEAHTSELQSLMRSSYAVFRLKNKILAQQLYSRRRKNRQTTHTHPQTH